MISPPQKKFLQNLSLRSRLTALVAVMLVGIFGITVLNLQNLREVDAVLSLYQATTNVPLAGLVKIQYVAAGLGVMGVLFTSYFIRRRFLTPAESAIASLGAATQGDYSRHLDASGPLGSAVNSVLKAFEISQRDFVGQLDAISRSQAVIEFEMDGTILTANDNFLNTLGYTLDEIQGQHHRMFAEPELAESPEYKHFWESLNRGTFQAGEFKRIDKSGQEIWIQASYNLILDESGKPQKVVKYATNITEQVKVREEAVKLRMVVEKSENMIVMVDRNMIVSYANDSTFSMLNKYASTFQEMFPGFDPNQLIGASIDQFHKNPKHQRDLLADPKNLPYKTEIQAGPLTFAMTVTAQLDTEGNYIGNALEWKDVTLERQMTARKEKVAEYRASEVKKVSKILNLAAEGDLTQVYKVAEADACTSETHDTFVEIATALNAMCANLREVLSGVAKNAESLNSSSTELSTTATQLELGADDTTNRSATVSSAAEEMSINMKNMATSTEQMTSNVQSVSAALEGMTASISEIAQNAEQASSVAGNATNLAESSNETIGQLGSAANEIGKVIEVIQDIAEQTNLLALNATIEAARAGDAGKGFAVVANEVKELAKQTAHATEDIRSRITGIQGSTQGVVKSIDEISKVIAEVNSVSQTIAYSVEEQSITAKEIFKNIAQTSRAAATISTGVSESATACEEITRSITGVDESAKNTASAATLAKETGGALSSLAGELLGLVGKFNV